MSNNSKNIHKERPSVWLDTTTINGKLMWGLECSDKSLTYDGHYICIFPYEDQEKARQVGEMLLDAIQGKFQFKRF